MTIDEHLELMRNKLTHTWIDYEQIALLEELQKLRKAYSLMAVKYCKHTDCCLCEVSDMCVEYRGKIRGAKHLENYFIKEAQKEAEK